MKIFYILLLTSFASTMTQFKPITTKVISDKPITFTEFTLGIDRKGLISLKFNDESEDSVTILPSYSEFINNQKNATKALSNSDDNSSSVKSIATLLSEMPKSSNNTSETAVVVNQYSIFNHMLLFASGIVIGVLGLETLQYIHAQYSTTKIFDLFWINWVSENISNDDELLQEKLIEMINQKYANSINRSQLFSMEIDHEIAILEKYLKDNESSFSRKFFSIVEKRLQKAQLAVQHLYYIKALIN